MLCTYIYTLLGIGLLALLCRSGSFLFLGNGSCILDWDNACRWLEMAFVNVVLFIIWIDLPYGQIFLDVSYWAGLPWYFFVISGLSTLPGLEQLSLSISLLCIWYVYGQECKSCLVTMCISVQFYFSAHQREILLSCLFFYLSGSWSEFIANLFWRCTNFDTLFLDQQRCWKE